MASYVGPVIPLDNLTFYVDGKNEKSYVSGSTITDFISKEQKTTTSTSQNGFIYSNYGTLDKFTNFTLSDVTAITVNIAIDNSIRNSGIVFSFFDDTNISYLPTGITTFTFVNTGIITSTTPVTHTSTQYSSSGITTFQFTQEDNTTATSTVTHTSTQYSSSGITTFTFVNTGIITSTTPVTHTSTQYSSSGITTFQFTQEDNTTATSTVTHTSTQYSSSGITTFQTTLEQTKLTNYINLYNFNPEFELTCFATSDSITVINNNATRRTYLTAPNSETGNIFSLIFRASGGGSPFSPITIYKNGQLNSNSDTTSQIGTFKNTGISLFNVNSGNYSTYGVRFVSLYKTALSEQNIKLIYNLK